MLIDLFISYSKEDSKFVGKLYRELQRFRVRGFKDNFDIASGAKISRQIQETIESSNAVVVILSRAAKNSEYLMLELGLAQSLGKPIIPVLAPNEPFDQSVPEKLIDMAVTDAGRCAIEETAAKVVAAAAGMSVAEATEKLRGGKLIGRNQFFVIIASAILSVVGVSFFFFRPRRITASVYRIQETTCVVDFGGWLPVVDETSAQIDSPVLLTRIDTFEKVSDRDESFIIPQYTTGKRITCNPLESPPGAKAVYSVIENPPGEEKTLGYQYELPIGKENSGFTATVKNEFVFINGFKNKPKEWWAASIRYPTKRLNVELRFPTGKPCKKTAVYLVEGRIGEKKPLVDSPPILSEAGHILKWTGKDLPPKSRLFFEFDW